MSPQLQVLQVDSEYICDLRNSAGFLDCAPAAEPFAMKSLPSDSACPATRGRHRLRPHRAARPSGACRHARLRAGRRRSRRRRCRWCCPRVGDALDADTLARRSMASSSPAARRTWTPARYGAAGAASRPCCWTAIAMPPSCRCCRRWSLPACRCWRCAAASRRSTSPGAARWSPPCTSRPAGSITAKAITIARSSAGTTTATSLHIVEGGLLATLAGGTHDPGEFAAPPGHRAPGRRLARRGQGARTAWSKPSPSRPLPSSRLAVQWHPEMRIDDSAVRARHLRGLRRRLPAAPAAAPGAMAIA